MVSRYGPRFANRFELGGDGTKENPGVRWYFDSIGGIKK